MKRFALTVLGVVACTPQFEDAPWRVDETRVLAIASEPAEAEPGDPVQLSALVGSPDGTEIRPVTWGVCTRPRTSEERTAVTQACLQGERLDAANSSWALPMDACARFGPNVPPSDGDGPPQRPSDPDATGGYYVPVRAALEDATAFGAVRVRCDLPGVTRAIFEAYEAGYENNQNPSLERIEVDGVPAEPEMPVAVPADTPIDLEVVLGSDASESYVRYAVEQGDVVEAREWVRAQWFVTAGTLSRGQTVAEAPEGGDRLSTVWTTPEAEGIAYGWVVLSDARGGNTWRTFTVDVGQRP